MKLYLLRPVDYERGAWGGRYDTAYGFVVRAENEAEARHFAAHGSGLERGAGFEGEEPWFDPEQVTCQELGPEGEPGIVICDFLHG